MNEKINLEIQYTVDDYVRGSAFVLNRQFVFKYGSLIVVAVPLIVFLFTYLSDPEGFSEPTLTTALIKFSPVLTLCLVFLVVSVFTNSLLKWNLKRQFNSSPLLRAAQEVSFDDAGIKGETDLSSALTKWEAVVEAAETDKDFFFFISNKKALFVPKRAFADEFQINLLRALVRTKLGERAKF
ncbi:MAG TPA: YcxB family protein [Pyrinomonadaceae bacterium]|jgi:hypothetical protein